MFGTNLFAPQVLEEHSLRLPLSMLSLDLGGLSALALSLFSNLNEFERSRGPNDGISQRREPPTLCRKHVMVQKLHLVKVRVTSAQSQESSVFNLTEIASRQHSYKLPF